MNILVYPHELAMGGSQINAIELAAAVRDRGHNVTITAPDGVLSSMIRQLGLDYVPIPRAPYFPSIATAFQLSALARRIDADLIHTYEWRPAIECTFGPHFFAGTRMLATVLSMDISHLFPRHVSLIVGTQQLAQTRPAQKIWVLEPPIDDERNKARDVIAARSRWGFHDDEIVVSVICRLTTDLEKVEGVLEAIDVVGSMASSFKLRLIVAGDGACKADVDTAAASVNCRHGREIITVTGELLEPDAVYEASDIVLGMGSSALKGMAFSKPLIVQGTAGFWRLFDEQSMSLFLYQGLFGHGGRGRVELRSILEKLAADKDRRTILGNFGRSVIEERFSLDLMADRLIEIYQQTVSEKQRLDKRLGSMSRTLFDVAKFRAKMEWHALRYAIRGRSV
ncbi:glycosyltransferase family 4 protein [Rhizobium mesoamericanum]|uniref:glycosyltransferase family 4 protein n=1 Tax=Rhizobium mesoamericanum TaxID=1079800 RepID=UPI000407B184|nr:glycosyltransferase family 4 protein [Rhizobium mesoamericanum]